MTKDVRGFIVVCDENEALIWTEGKLTAIYKGDITNDHGLKLSETIECTIEPHEGSGEPNWKVVQNPAPIRVDSAFKAEPKGRRSVVTSIVTVPNRFKNEKECYDFLDSDHYGRIVAGDPFRELSYYVTTTAGQKIRLSKFKHGIDYEVILSPWIADGEVILSPWITDGKITWEIFTMDGYKIELKDKHHFPCQLAVAGPDNDSMDPKEVIAGYVQELWEYKNVRDAVRDANSFLFRMTDKWVRNNPGPPLD